MNTDDKKIELNYYPITYKGSFDGEQSNNPSVPPDSSNLLDGGQGSIMASGVSSSGNYSTGVAGWKLDANGNIEANDGNFRGDITGASGTFSGTITATTGNIGGWSINSTSIYTGTEDHSGYTANAGDITFYSDGTDSSIHAFNWYIDTNGTFTTRSGVMSGVSIASIPNDASTDISLLDFTYNMAFSVTDADTIAWGSGTITMSNGRTFSISAGNTGNMSALTYIYLDTGVSTTVLQTTTTYSTAMGANKKLIGTAKNNTVTASFIPFNGSQPLIDGQNIGSLSIVAGNIAASTITGAKIAATTITAANITAGTITTTEIAATTITGANINTLNISGKTATFDTGTIGGFTMSATTLSATNFSVTSGAANTARLEVGTGSNIGGVNSGNASGDIAFWAGSTFANRATAPFRVTMGGAITATSATISGYVLSTKGAFGGDGSDGALSISSGTTTIDAASAAVVIKNYTSISITGTGKLTISNPHANGTILILKSQGNVTITSSTSPAIDMKGMGADGGAAGVNQGDAGTDGSDGNSNIIFMTDHGNKGVVSPTTADGAGGTKLGSFISGAAKMIPLFCGAGGGGASRGTGGAGSQGGGGGSSAVTNGSAAGGFGTAGSGTGGAGGKGGGCLYIECAGSYSVSSTLSVAGNDGSAGAATNGSGGGAGAGGSMIILYNTLTSDTGTYTVAGGTKGAKSGSGSDGGDGGAGYSLITTNNIYA